MISIENLCKKFNNKKVLEGIDLEVKSNQVITILGPNGSGKTTLIKSILRMLLLDKGNVYVDGVDISTTSGYRKKITYLPQNTSFPHNLKVYELLEMIKDLRGENTDYFPLINRFNLNRYLYHKTSTLSEGTKQKINLVITFMFDCPIIILDEPTTGLDPISIIKLKELIHLEKKNKIIIIASHLISFIEEVSSKVVFLFDGKVYYKGSIKKLKEKSSIKKVDNKSFLSDLENSIIKILKKKDV